MEIKNRFQELLNLVRSHINNKKSRTFISGGLGSLFLRLSHTVFSFLIGVVLARILGAESLGTYAFIFAIINIMSIPAQLGLPNLIVKYVAKYQAHKEWANIKGLIKISNFSVLIISMLLIGVSMLGINFKILNFQDDQLRVFYWGLALIPVLALAAIRGAFLRGLRHVVLGLAPENTIKHILFIFLLIIAHKWVVESAFIPSYAMSLNFFSTFIAYIFGAYWLFRKLPSEVKKAKPKYKFKEWSTVAIPLLLTGGMQIINSKIDIILLGWLGTATQVGIYEVSWKGAALVSFGLGALNLLLAPYFSRYFYTNQLDSLQKIVTLTVIFNCILGITVTCIYFIFGEALLSFFFGFEFSAGYNTLMILSIAHLVNVASGSVGLLLNMTGHERKVLTVLAIAAITNIFLNIYMIPLYGMEGAAIASFFTYLIWNILLVVMSLKQLNINTSVFSVIRFIK